MKREDCCENCKFGRYNTCIKNGYLGNDGNLVYVSNDNWCEDHVRDDTPREDWYE